MNQIDRSPLFAVQPWLACLILAFHSHAWALPTGGQVVAGQATISDADHQVVVDQSSQRAVLNWQSFNVGAGDAVRFNQPGHDAVTLNRVLGNDPSRILGQISANGQVFLLNPNGVLFGQGASVNVGGLVASTLSMSNEDFLAGRYHLAGAGSGRIVNQGHLQADSGYVALLGQEVVNEGVIEARLGSIALASGDRMTLDLTGDGLLNVAVTDGVAQALVTNRGVLQADGGQVLMSTQVAGDVLASAVNNTGLIQAQTIERHDGVIRLLAGANQGQVLVGGRIDASAPGAGDGGHIETSAAHVVVDPALQLSTSASQGRTGQWLLDPVDFTIAASGGDITGALLSSLLGSSNVTLQTATGTDTASQLYGSSGYGGDIFVNDTVTWSAHQLTLHAWRNIEVNSPLNASGSATLAFEYGQGAVAAGNTASYSVHAPINLPAGQTFSTLLGSDGTVVNYTVLTTLGADGSTTGTDLQGMQADLSAAYALGADIDASATAGWGGGAGFLPIGLGGQFSGTLDGLGHTISHLSIQRPTSDNVGLISHSYYGTVRHLALTDANVVGQNNVGALVGNGDWGYLGDVSVAGGGVSGLNYVGGLMGMAHESTTERSHTGITVQGQDNVGGLIGFDAHIVQQSYATGDVSGRNSVGGLTGASTGNIVNSYATGNVSGDSYLGGLTGYTNSWVWNAYATGNVTGTGDQIGGLIGHNGAGVNYTYATGAVSGPGPNVGGLAGYADYNNLTNSFWDVTTSGQATSAGGAVGMSSADLMSGVNFTSATAANGHNNPGWNLNSDWILYEGHTMPLLRPFMTPLTVTVSSATKTYDGQAYSGGASSTYSATPDSRLLGTVSYTDLSGDVNAGSYQIGAQGFYSDQQGYAVTYVPGWLTVQPATVTLSATKVYDGTTDLSGAVTVATGIAGESLTYTSAYANDAHAATADKFIQSLILLDGPGGLASNYQLPTLDVAHAPVTITPAPLSASVTNSGATKVYDGTTQAPAGWTPTYSFSGLASGDSDAALTYTAVAYNQATVAGANKLTLSGVTLTGVSGSNGSQASDYQFSSSSLDVAASITPAALTVSAVNASKSYGAGMPPLAAEISGFVAGESLASSGVTGQAQVQTSANALSEVGTYDITVGQGSLSASNYTFQSFVPGVLTVRSALPTEDVANAISSALVVPAVNKVSLAPSNTATPATTSVPTSAVPGAGAGPQGLGLS
ncbi:MAG TPA: filamentous hemagglutinin N-terminal domain-containing protein, partial [Aquabacterium sp.]|nr:filamentous hemagglutinin N-terminal domain-containing protein [Aquabacterium sp.]